MPFDKPYFHDESSCGCLLELESEAPGDPEASFWYCPSCDVYTNEIKTVENA